MKVRMHLQIQRLSFDDQITCFEKTKSAIEAKIGVEASNKMLNQAVYLIGMGTVTLSSPFRPRLPPLDLLSLAN